MKKFQNEPLTDFSDKKNRKNFLASLEKVRSQFDLDYPLIIGDEKIYTEDKIFSVNPSDTNKVVGRVSKASPFHVDKAMEVANKTFNEWSKVTAKKRADFLFKAAKLMRKRKYDFAAWMVYEVSKNWTEADADVAEAIDFMEFYGREMLRYDKGVKLVKIKGEDTRQYYIPLGVGVIIPPWNFPLAILVGMTTAAIVTGNTVVLKPSSDSPVIAYKFMELLEEVGLPPGVVNYLPGSGSLIGDMLVSHPLTRFISFTGSKEVGLRINELAAKVQPGQKWIKRVIAEMGGKDGIIIDSELDSLEEAASGVISSAFGFQGQKCSACSRVIVDEKIYDKFIDLLVDKAATLTVGEAQYNPSMAAVINKRSEDSILAYINKAKEEGGRVVFGGSKAEGNGFFIQPTIIADVRPHDTIAQEEIFGPVLAVIKARDFDEALQIANDTEYGLTGSAYSANKKKLKKAA
ncbi:MAG: L-glutamate gamma-semialdehyde dehydrogenase, partial [Ignavibacteria bacterium]|nr:L-glutamate gamma-semialdehyde dehydrogenase [Ignavibacteria bacterium]